jgi:hypothetical protein
LEDIMGDLTALNAALTELQTDVTALLASANDQAAIDTATSTVTTLDTQVKAALPAPPAPPA